MAYSPMGSTPSVSSAPAPRTLLIPYTAPVEYATMRLARYFWHTTPGIHVLIAHVSATRSFEPC